MADAVPVRVGYLAPCFLMGGAETWFLALAGHTDPRAVQWTGTTIAYRHRAPPSDLLSALASAMPVAQGTAAYNPRAPLGDQELVDELRRAAAPMLARSEVVVCYGFHLLREVLDGFHGRVVYVSHGVGSHGRDVLMRNASVVDAIVAVSEFAYHHLPATLRDRSVVIRNGIDASRLAPRYADRSDWLATLDLPPHARVVGFVGRISAEKNPLAAAHAVGALGEPWYAVYVGLAPGDPEYPVVEAAAGGRLRVVPAAFGAVEALAHFDCLVNMSYEEGFGLSLAEAWHVGTPCVATATGVVPELSARFGPLVVTQPADAPPAALAAAVAAAVSPDAKGMVERARSVAREHLTASRMGAQWSGLLQALASRRPSSGAPTREPYAPR